MFCVPGVELPAVHQRRHQPRPGALHLALLHRPALGAALPGVRRLLQLLPRPLRRAAAGAAAERPGPAVQPRREQRAAAADVRGVDGDVQ